MQILDYEPRKTARARFVRLRERLAGLRDVWYLLLLLGLMLASFNL